MESETSIIYKELTPSVIPLDNICLDPNNPRFTSMRWTEVHEERIDDPTIQSTVRKKLEDEFSVDRLVMNIETNGFLPID